MKIQPHLFPPASGLFYLAEWVEEYTVLTKKIIRWTIIVVIIFHLLLMLFEDFPILYLLFGIIAHLAYSSLLPSFPFIEFFGIQFISSVGPCSNTSTCRCSSELLFVLTHLCTALCCLLPTVLAIADHCLWLWYFTQYYYPFPEILAFIVIIVWVHFLPQRALLQHNPNSHHSHRRCPFCFSFLSPPAKTACPEATGHQFLARKRRASISAPFSPL